MLQVKSISIRLLAVLLVALTMSAAGPAAATLAAPPIGPRSKPA